MIGAPRKERKGYLFKRGRNGEYLSAGSKKWGIYYLQYDVSGKRCKICLGTANRDTAEQERKKIMAPLLVASEKDALNVLKQRIKDTEEKLDGLEKEKHPPLSIDGTWQAYLSSVDRPDSGPRTLCGYASQFSRFSAWLKQTHPDCVFLCNVTPDIAREYAGHLVGAGLTENTFNKHIRLLELVFRVLSDDTGLTHNPWNKITRKKEKKESRRELTTDELRNICNNASGELKTLLALGLYTGMRLGDCCTLRWSEVDLQRKLILRIPNKTARTKGNILHIPLHPSLISILSEIPVSERKEYVLPGFADQYRTNDSDVAKKLRKYFESCGIRAHKENTGKGTDKRAVVEVGFHSLRHSFVSLCRSANAPLAVVESIVGHSNPAMTRHYTHVSELAAGQAVAALPALGESGKSGKETRPPENTIPELSAILPELQRMNARNWRNIRDDLVRKGGLSEHAALRLPKKVGRALRARRS